MFLIRCLVNYKWLFIISLYEVLKVHYNKYSLRLLIKNEAGSHLLSHTVSSAVPSAAYVLTIVFGMGTGVTRKRITTGKLLVILDHSILMHPPTYYSLERR